MGISHDFDRGYAEYYIAILFITMALAAFSKGLKIMVEKKPRPTIFGHF